MGAGGGFGVLGDFSNVQFGMQQWYANVSNLWVNRMSLATDILTKN